MSKVKISWKLGDYGVGRYYRRRKNSKPVDSCLLCGAALKDPKSKKRGYGHKCLNKFPVILILEIPPGDSQ